MSIEISQPARQQAVASIERYCLEHLDERIGNIAAEGLLNFFLKEVGPSIYNQAVADAQSRLQARVMELDIEVHEEEFTFWNSASRPAGKRQGPGRNGVRTSAGADWPLPPAGSARTPDRW